MIVAALTPTAVETMGGGAIYLGTTVVAGMWPAEGIPQAESNGNTDSACNQAPDSFEKAA